MYWARVKLKKLKKTQNPLIVLMVTIFLISHFISVVSGEVFKWKDVMGNIHYTDNINNIPKKFRKPPYLQNMPRFLSRINPSKSIKLNVKSIPTIENGESGKEEEEGAEIINQEEKLAIQETVSFLRSQAERNETLTKMIPSERNGKIFVVNIQQSFERKKALIEKLSKSESLLLQEAYNFLKTSLMEDEKVRITGPRMKNRSIQILNRLEKEMAAESLLAKELEKKLQGDYKKEALQKEESKKVKESGESKQPENKTH